jgi:CubicO group peptidase (beta-lactamase class C family)
MRIIFCCLCFLLSVTSTSFGNDVTSAVSEAIEPFIEAGEISGAVTLVARDGETVSLEALGVSDLNTRRAMREDDLFWIASMTKPMVGVALMMLAEEGKLDIHDDLEKHLPEFNVKDLWVVAEKSKNAMTLKRPSRRITLLDLATHTAGIPNVSEPRSHSTLAELVSMVSQRPLEFEPGSRWKYSTAGTIGTEGVLIHAQWRAGIFQGSIVIAQRFMVKLKL